MITSRDLLSIQTRQIEVGRHLVYTWCTPVRYRMAAHGMWRFNNPPQHEAVRRANILAACISMALSVDEDEMALMERVARRRRTHEFWMSPYLFARTDNRQRNTMAKLESDFLRVSIFFYNFSFINFFFIIK